VSCQTLCLLNRMVGVASKLVVLLRVPLGTVQWQIYLTNNFIYVNSIDLSEKFYSCTYYRMELSFFIAEIAFSAFAYI
jgi:hypothetical protein